jgi:hypothetical protein
VWRVRLVEGQLRVAAQMAERFTGLNQNAEACSRRPKRPQPLDRL